MSEPIAHTRALNASNALELNIGSKQLRSKLNTNAYYDTEVMGIVGHDFVTLVPGILNIFLSKQVTTFGSNTEYDDNDSQNVLVGWSYTQTPIRATDAKLSLFNYRGYKPYTVEVSPTTYTDSSGTTITLEKTVRDCGFTVPVTENNTNNRVKNNGTLHNITDFLNGDVYPSSNFSSFSTRYNDLTGEKKVAAVTMEARFPMCNPHEHFNQNFDARSERSQAGVCQTISDSPLTQLYIRSPQLGSLMSVATTEKFMDSKDNRWTTIERVSNPSSSTSKYHVQNRVVSIMRPDQSYVSGICAKISLASPGYRTTSFVSGPILKNNFHSSSKREIDFEIVDENGKLVETRGTVMSFTMKYVTSV